MTDERVHVRASNHSIAAGRDISIVFNPEEPICPRCEIRRLRSPQMTICNACTAKERDDRSQLVLILFLALLAILTGSIFANFRHYGLSLGGAFTTAAVLILLGSWAVVIVRYRRQARSDQSTDDEAGDS